MTEPNGGVGQPFASGSGVSLVQHGWHVIARGGEDLGRVSHLDDDRLTIAREGITTPAHLIIPRDLIEDEDESTMQVFLAVDSATADGFAGDAG